MICATETLTLSRVPAVVCTASNSVDELIAVAAVRSSMVTTAGYCVVM